MEEAYTATITVSVTVVGMNALNTGSIILVDQLSGYSVKIEH